MLFWPSVLCFYAAYAGESRIGQLAILLLETVAGSGVPRVQLYIQINGRETLWPNWL